MALVKKEDETSLPPLKRGSDPSFNYLCTNKPLIYRCLEPSLVTVVIGASR